MRFSHMTDEEIMKELGKRVDLIRRSKELSDAELVKRGGTNDALLNRFRSNRGGISLVNFIKLLRGLGLLERLDQLLEVEQGYSPARHKEKEPPRRIHKKSTKPDDFVWDEDK